MGTVPLNQLVKEKNAEVEWKAFELRPEGMEPPKMPDGYYEQAKKNVQMMAEQYGLEMHWNDKSKHSRRALEGAKFAEKNGRAHEYHEAVFKAQFQQNKNINDIDTLAQIASDLGLDEEDFRQALESREYEQEVLADHEEAQQIGITAVPCFVSGNRGVMGAQPYEALVKLVEEN
ncbi:DsbA family protein [Evansella sp. LMS18]|uniref:DsbA family oxidoreductase n=1 Tax=Evansella sp. LMS18 TaxID=2924033 RepID=UPI0020D19E45|nr:DsbA family protein [Evansella sp. LMS18]